ncbi:hypothetical protein ES705_26104 [subsurface metagenome]
MEEENSLFTNGSIWLRTDFHLHTKADKDFFYDGEENDYINLYIKQLKSNNVGIGVITNHNKFDLNEFKILKKKANKNNIFLLPGVELSVNDGANGIHCLIVFNYNTWIIDKENFFDQFLNYAFEGIANRENENTRCKYNITSLLEKLDEHRNQGRDSFIIMAHIEQRSGFCNELDGGRISQLATNELFRESVIGLQKIRTHDLFKNLIIWYGGEEKLPAFIEGSDPKKIEEVGICSQQKNENNHILNKKCYIKIGDFNFEAIKYALLDKKYRLSSDIKPIIDNSFIKSITFEGKLLNDKKINFSPELNSIIGIRGSGKSAIIEIIRYTLGMSLGTQTIDRNYKNGLIEYVLGSGGKVIVNLINEHQEEYTIEKIYGQKEDIYKDGLRHDISIDAIFKHPVYFGQKDLSNKDIDFEAYLVIKLIGNSLESIRTQIDSKKSEIKNIITNINNLKNLKELKSETETNIKDAEHQLKLYKEKGVESKLKQQSLFDSDITKLNDIQITINDIAYDLNELIEGYSYFFKQEPPESEINKDIFEGGKQILSQLKDEFNKLNDALKNINILSKKFNSIIKGLETKKEGLKEEFAKIKRSFLRSTCFSAYFISSRTKRK